MILKVEGVTKTFGGLAALRGISFEVPEGQILGLIGPNGAGKTTLFNVMSGFYAPDSGRVIFDGESVGHMKSYDICKRGLARTFQVVKPFGNLTVLQNVMVGSFLHASGTIDAERQALDAMEFVGLAGQGDKEAKSLTISDRKRLEVARALATRPKVLLLDEVMAGLNSTELVEMLGIIKRMRERGMTLIVIEHIMAAIMSVSERIVVLHHGEKIAEGVPAEVARDRRVIEAYLGEEYLLA